MTRVDEYRRELRAHDGWDPYLAARSGLPGPRANLELVEAVAQEGNEAIFRRLAGSEDEFLAMCGVFGLGRLVAEGRDELLSRIREAAVDPRWRVREAAALALQRIGDRDTERLLEIVEDWSRGALLEQRAAVAGIAEPRLLRGRETVRRALAVLGGVTETVAARAEGDAEEARVLRRALGYAWSIVVAADPDQGKPALEQWLDSDVADVRWAMRENLRKARLRRVDAAWVEECLKRLGS